MLDTALDEFYICFMKYIYEQLELICLRACLSRYLTRNGSLTGAKPIFLLRPPTNTGQVGKWLQQIGALKS